MPARGVNLLQYRIDEPNHGYVSEFHLARALITGHLAKLREQGYSWVSFPLLYWHGVSNGLTMDSTGGVLPPQQMQNVADILALCKSLDFSMVVLRFLPEGPDDAMHNWTSWNEPFYTESWLLVNAIRRVAVSSGMPYLLDLAGEGVADPATLWGEYSQRLWVDYTGVYGSGPTKQVSDATVSFIPSGTPFVSQTFSGNLPPLFLLDLYRGSDYGVGAGHEALVKVKQGLPTGVPLGVLETFHDYTTLAEMNYESDLVVVAEWPLLAGPPGPQQNIVFGG